MSPKDVLEKVFGYPDFRGDQEMVIEGVLRGQSALLLMPTGMGKSLCFQIPARILGGVTIVLSPLIALMKDQVDQALKKGFRTTFINSSLSREERVERLQKLRQGAYELLYVTPERFRSAEFCEAIQTQKISLLAIDEAHCISEWGHDFRPDYSRVGEIREFLGNPTTLAVTATATPEVQKDILKQLHLSDAPIYHHGIQRENLSLSYHFVYGLDEKVRSIVGLRHLHPGAAIVYVSLISTIRKLETELHRLGMFPFVYHGDLSSQARKKNQNEFLSSQDGFILATPAFGLGIDKPNVRLIVHAEIPGSLEAYWQEAGRAGRDGESSACALLYDGDDVSIQQDFIKWSTPDRGFILKVFSLLRDKSDRFLMEGLDYLRRELNFYNTRDYRVETSLNLLERAGAIEGNWDKRQVKILKEPEGEWLDSHHIEARTKKLNEKLYKMVEYTQTTECRAQFISHYFGLGTALLCGRCDNCLNNQQPEK